MERFGISGLWKDPQSTLTGIIGLAVTLGALNQAQAGTITALLPQLISGLAAIASLIKLFYKGTPAA
ncbi:MAG: hypothetical protein M1438_19925 [Deltaproteobacteria bacterium]|nr:hypothetical protein [Deltaproteobacteria bacterium]